MTMRPVPKDIDPDEREFGHRYAMELETLRAVTAGCPHPDLIAVVSMEVLPEDVSADIRAHLAGCAVCREMEYSFRKAPETRLDQARLDDLWKHIAAKTAKPRPASARPLYIGIAAALLLAVGLANFIFLPERLADAPPSPVRAPAEPPGFILPLSKAELRLPLDSLTWRGNEAVEQQRYLSQLGVALEPYRRDEFAQSIPGFEQLTRQYPNAVEPLVYGAVSLLHANRPEEARNWLEQARRIGSSTLAHDIEWYLALAYERTAQSNDASRILEKLCGSEGLYRRQACDFYPRLRRP